MTNPLRPMRLLPLLLLLLPGCFLSESTINRPIDADLLEALQPGTTSALEVAERLGAPDQVVELGDRQAWLYRHTHEKQSALFLLVLGLRGVDIQSDRVWVFFDAGGTVTHVGVTLDGDQASFGLPG